LPEWVAALEVYDAGRLQNAIQKIVDATHGRTGDRTPLTLGAETVNGQTWHTIRGLPVEVHYIYANGYLLAGANRQTIARALQHKVNGYTIGRSEKFVSLLPRDGHTNFSAMFYQNIAGRLAGVAETLSPQLRESLGDLGKETKPMLVLAYGEADRIVLASQGSFYGAGLGNILGGMPLGVMQGKDGKHH
jgi:hypothetical protein